MWVWLPLPELFHVRRRLIVANDRQWTEDLIAITTQDLSRMLEMCVGLTTKASLSSPPSSSHATRQWFGVRAAAYLLGWGTVGELDVENHVKGFGRGRGWRIWHGCLLLLASSKSEGVVSIIIAQ